MNIKNCRGRFKIHADKVYECSEQIRIIMGSCSIVRVDYGCNENEFNYLAISPLFREIPFGERCPEYVWIFHSDGDVELKELVCEPINEDSIKSASLRLEKYNLFSGI